MRKEHGIEQLKDREIGADADGQGEYSRGREAGRFAQLPKRIPCVVPNAAKNHGRIGENNMLFGHLWVAETRQRVVPCMLGRHALGKVVLSSHLDMRL